MQQYFTQDFKPNLISSFQDMTSVMPVCAKSLQSYLIFCDPMECSLPCSSIHGILQIRILEWVSISFSRGSSCPRDGTRVSCVFCISRQSLYQKCHLGSPAECIDLGYYSTESTFVYLLLGFLSIIVYIL